MSVYIQAVKKRGFLRQIAERAKKSALTLKETLLAVQGGQFSNTFQGGKILASTSGSGQSGSFEIWLQGKEWTPDNVFGLTEELIELCEQKLTDGVADDVDTLFAAMMTDEALHGIRQQMGDFSGLNYPATSL